MYIYRKVMQQGRDLPYIPKKMRAAPPRKRSSLLSHGPKCISKQAFFPLLSHHGKFWFLQQNQASLPAGECRPTQGAALRLLLGSGASLLSSVWYESAPSTTTHMETLDQSLFWICFLLVEIMGSAMVWDPEQEGDWIVQAEEKEKNGCTCALTGTMSVPQRGFC